MFIILYYYKTKYNTTSLYQYSNDLCINMGTSVNNKKH